MNRFVGLICAVSIMVSLAGVIGCGSASPNAALSSANKSNIQRLSNLYVMYQMKNKFNGPKNEAEFKEFLKSAKTETLAAMGVDQNAIDDLFICEKDGEPFTIRYGLKSGPRGSTEAAVFQTTGSDRMVGFLNMVQRSVDDDEYENLLGKKPVVTKKKRSARGASENRSSSGS